MIFRGKHGITFELQIDGYQFPAIEGEIEDANWLMVRGAVSLPEGAWTFVDPCLTTIECEGLADWLDRVAEGSVNEPVLFFTEPNLGFEYAAHPVEMMTVRLSYECAPPWAGIAGTAVSFPLSLNEPREAARSLRAALARFPPRAASPSE
jgi:hypothetical protein